jgi:5-hydroxyisourate hydrolase-like protein (transthyretin family)
METQTPQQVTTSANLAKDALNVLRYLFLASVIFIGISQILLNLIPYEAIVTQVSHAGNNLSVQIVQGLASGVTRVEDSNGNVTELKNTSETELISSAIGAIINIIFVSLIFLLAILFALSVALTIIGMLLLSQSRNLLESILLVVSFAIPRQRKHWGVIFDQSTNSPVPFASVRVVTKTNENQITQIAQTVADLDGRYRLYVADRTRTYNLLVSAPGYADAARLVENLKANELVEDIALNHVGVQDKNLRLWLSNLRPQISNRVISYLYFLSILATFFAVYNLVQYRRQIDYIALLIYGFGFIWNTLFFRDRRSSKAGRILDEANDVPIESAFVRVLRGGKTLTSAVTDANGVAKFDLEPGTYLLEVNKPNYAIVSDSLTEGNLDMVKINAQGYLSKNVLLRKQQSPVDPTKPESDLMNPFA